MTTTSTALDSPPELSDSRSSKSSSQLSAPDGILSDISNFEEIGLEDDARMTYVENLMAGPYNLAKMPLPRVSSLDPRESPPTTLTRELTTTNRPAYPTLHGQVKDATNHRRGASFSGPKSAEPLKRGLTSPRVLAFPFPSPNAENQPRTRSSSPTHRAAVTACHATANGISLRPAVSPRSALQPPLRRGSWQPGRKSIKELEAEYHDSDDDLPDDASLWNVPMSPRPPSERTASARSSRRGSPDRDSRPHGPMPLPLSHAISAPEVPPHPGPSTTSLSEIRPPSPGTSSLHTPNSFLSSPSAPPKRKLLRNARAKSWTVAMSELSEEAKVLSETLEFHAEAGERLREEQMQKSNKSARPSLNAPAKWASRATVIELPPVQQSSLDFMPISKEKEALLSRTRPSWLPPKDPKEEKKHVKEYQRIMTASIEAEKKKEQRTKVERCQKEDTREALNRIWEHHVFPAWENVVSEHRTRQLWWRGVSPKVRGKVWERAIGNHLGLTEQSYQKALQRAKEIQMRNFEELGEQEKVMKGWFMDIEKDAETAYVELNLFRREGSMWQDLVDVCSAYACYRSDVGFLYGVHLLAALLLLQLPTPSSVFIVLANSLNRAMPLGFLTSDPGITSRAYDIAISTLSMHFPFLYGHLFGPGERGGLTMSGGEVFEPMFRTMFANGLDLERLARVWDCWVFEGDRVLVRAAVAILGCLEAQILGLEGSLEGKRMAVTEMLGWGPTGRKGGYWDLGVRGGVDEYMKEVKKVGRRR